MHFSVPDVNVEQPRRQARERPRDRSRGRRSQLSEVTALACLTLCWGLPPGVYHDPRLPSRGKKQAHMKASSTRLSARVPFA
jgi:hypothetical protein